MSESLIIAIDGPSGAGKSTLGRMLARELGLLYIDTGSMYRAVALAVIESTINESDDVAVGSLASRIDIDLAGDPDSLRVTLEGDDVTDRIRDEDVTQMSSIISTIPAVRRAMVQRQRELGQRGAVLAMYALGAVSGSAAILVSYLSARGALLAASVATALLLAGVVLLERAPYERQAAKAEIAA